MIGKLERVSLRQVWPHEAHDFTAWLTENIDILGDVINLELSNAEREQAAGSFSADIVAEDVNGNTVIIENQLEKSDHDHLGKIITYLSAFDARAAVWIVAEPRPEHVQAIVWLNEASSGAFFLLKVEAVKIGTSEPAPLLTMIVGPSEEAKEVGEKKRDLAERHHVRKRFWTGLLEHAGTRTRLHSNISPRFNNYLSASAGKPGLGYVYRITQRGVSVELYIDFGDENENTRVFDFLYENREPIEAAFGDELDWRPIKDKRACRIIHYPESGGWRDENRWPELFEQAVDRMIRFDETLSPYFEQV